MKVTVLGSGTSNGVPMPACDCRVCHSLEPRNNRSRTSIWIQGDAGESVIVDTGPDFRTQTIREKIKHIDAILYTHAHADHIVGFPDIRSFNFANKKVIPIYATEYAAKELQATFRYAFSPDPNYVGGGVPNIDLNLFVPGETLTIGTLQLQTFSLVHGFMEVVGFRLGDFAYATDCKEIPSVAKKIIYGAKNLIIDALRIKPIHPTHLTLDEAVAMSQELAVEQAYGIHMTHEIDYIDVSRQLPNNFRLSFDGLTIDVT